MRSTGGPEDIKENQSISLCGLCASVFPCFSLEEEILLEWVRSLWPLTGFRETRR